MHDDGIAARLPADGSNGKLCVQYAPLDTVLVSSSEDGSLNTWDTATCQAKESYRMLHKVCLRLALLASVHLQGNACCTSYQIAKSMDEFNAFHTHFCTFIQQHKFY